MINARKKGWDLPRQGHQENRATQDIEEFALLSRAMFIRKLADYRKISDKGPWYFLRELFKGVYFRGAWLRFKIGYEMRYATRVFKIDNK